MLYYWNVKDIYISSVWKGQSSLGYCRGAFWTLLQFIALEDDNVYCRWLTPIDFQLCKQHIKHKRNVDVENLAGSDHEIATCVSSMTLILAFLPSFKAALT